jgi:glutaredoxin-related protein
MDRVLGGVSFGGDNADMTRPSLPEHRLHPAIRARVAADHADLVREVEAAVATQPVVVVGMAWNPFCKRARRALQAAGVPHQYLAYGSYTAQWRRRNALKMWTGWPTFPMVFVRGTLVGGAQDLEALIASGELQRLLA